MKKVCMIGTGYVGLVTGTCFAELGHQVICVDKDKRKIDTLNAGKIPIYEPGLEKLVKKHSKSKRLTFTTSLKHGVIHSDIIFIAVNTPPLPDGGADLSYVEACTREVAQYASQYKILVEKSTVPVQTGDRIKKTLAVLNKSRKLIDVASNPEFLREGSAVQDFLNPDRVVLGVQTKKSEKVLRELYKRIKAPIIVTDINSAELIKHASNSFLAMKISYINALSQICERVGADIEKVAEGMGHDKRIGRPFLYPGIGYGGSCFPKDVSAFIKIAESNGYNFEMLKATQKINQEQRFNILKKLEEALWTFRNKNVGVWGLSFKPDTDDLRNAPAIDIIQGLIDGGSIVKAYDPVAMENMKNIFPDITYCKNPYEVARNSDAIIVVTEWGVFKKIDLKKVKRLMKTSIIIDGRNVFDPALMSKLGFTYQCVGRTLSPIYAQN